MSSPSEEQDLRCPDGEIQLDKSRKREAHPSRKARESPILEVHARRSKIERFTLGSVEDLELPHGDKGPSERVADREVCRGAPKSRRDEKAPGHPQHRRNQTPK